ncbi:MAG: hypothetical protein WCP20_02185 [Desulfuromonadales bacterium]
MATMEKNIKSIRKNRKRQRVRAKEQSVLSVVSLRISDEEKNRIDEIMRNGNIKRYSDIMRMAIHLVQVPDNDEHEHAGIFH